MRTVFEHYNVLELRQLALGPLLAAGVGWGVSPLAGSMPLEGKSLHPASEPHTIRIHYHKFIFSCLNGCTNKRAADYFSLISAAFKGLILKGGSGGRTMKTHAGRRVEADTHTRRGWIPEVGSACPAFTKEPQDEMDTQRSGT